VLAVSEHPRRVWAYEVLAGQLLQLGGWGHERMRVTMFDRSIVFALVLLMLTTAVAGPDSDTVRKFGLFGTWAIDCSKPPSDVNTYEEFAPSETGYPTRTWYRKKSDRYAPAQSFEMRDVRVVGSGRLAYLDVRKSDGDLTNIVIAMVGNKQRSQEATDPKDGKVYIKDGKLVASAKPTELFQKCPGP
jgi:hypothetical protein